MDRKVMFAARVAVTVAVVTALVALTGVRRFELDKSDGPTQPAVKVTQPAQSNQPAAREQSISVPWLDSKVLSEAGLELRDDVSRLTESLQAFEGEHTPESNRAWSIMLNLLSAAAEMDCMKGAFQLDGNSLVADSISDQVMGDLIALRQLHLGNEPDRELSLLSRREIAWVCDVIHVYMRQQYPYESSDKPFVRVLNRELKFWRAATTER